MNLRTIGAIGVLVFQAGQARDATALVFTDVNHPDAATTGVFTGTFVMGIDGTTIVGNYAHESDGRQRGFMFDGTTYTDIIHPSESTTILNATNVWDIAGGTISGFYLDSSNGSHGFIFDGSSFSDIDHPEAGVGKTVVFGTDGGKVVGTFGDDTPGGHGFTFDGTSFTTLDHPLSIGETTLLDISGTSVVGEYSGGSFLYDGANFTDIVHPNEGPEPTQRTQAIAIDSNNIVGWYQDADNVFHGFFYHGGGFIDIDHPNADGSTSVFGIEGSTLVGYYHDSSGLAHGFITVIPEPSGTVLAALGGLLLAARRTTGRRNNK